MKNKRKILTVALVVLMLFVCACLSLRIRKESQNNSQVTTEKKDNFTNKPVVLMTNLQAPAYTSGSQKGYLGDVLLSKVGVEVAWEFGTGLIEEYASRPDIWQWIGDGGYDEYYKRIKNGELVNLDDEIKKHPEIYNRYQKVIDCIKKETRKQTGLDGIYSFPMALRSFEDTDIKRGMNYSVSIFTTSKNQEKALELLTYAASEEGIMNFVYGPENERWEKKNDKYYVIKEWSSDESSEYPVIEEADDGRLELSGRPGISLIGNEQLASCLIQPEKSRSSTVK